MTVVKLALFMEKRQFGLQESREVNTLEHLRKIYNSPFVLPFTTCGILVRHACFVVFCFVKVYSQITHSMIIKKLGKREANFHILNRILASIDQMTHWLLSPILTPSSMAISTWVFFPGGVLTLTMIEPESCCY